MSDAAVPEPPPQPDVPDEEDHPDPPVAVLDSLWIGGAPVDFAWAREHGIDVVVDVADPWFTPEPRDLEAIDYRKEALIDGPAMPDADLLRELVDGVVGNVRGGRRVLVHCAWGRNRSGLIVALALRDLLGVSGREAVRRLRDVRRLALNNEVFAEYVEGLAAVVDAERSADDAGREHGGDDGQDDPRRPGK